MRFIDFLRGDRSNGSKAASSGKANEREICDQLRRLRHHGDAIEVTEPAGTDKDKPDIVATLSGRQVTFELKTKNASEGGGSNLVYSDGRYARPKNPTVNRYYPAEKQPWDGRVPSCVAGTDKTLETWMREKVNFRDDYESVPDTAVAEYYRNKKVDYMHIRGKGIYHTGEDPMGWGVPLFAPPCRLRIRAKQHSGKSVPNDVQVCFNFRSRKLPPSPYDFMDPARLPPGFSAE